MLISFKNQKSNIRASQLVTFLEKRSALIATSFEEISNGAQLGEKERQEIQRQAVKTGEKKFEQYLKDHYSTASIAFMEAFEEKANTFLYKDKNAEALKQFLKDNSLLVDLDIAIEKVLEMLEKHATAQQEKYRPVLS